MSASASGSVTENEESGRKELIVIVAENVHKRESIGSLFKHFRLIIYQLILKVQRFAFKFYSVIACMPL